MITRIPQFGEETQPWQCPFLVEGDDDDGSDQSDQVQDQGGIRRRQ